MAGRAREDQNTSRAFLEFPMMAAIQKNLVFCLQYLISIINKISFSTVAVAQWVRRWSGGHRVVQAVGSSPRGDM